MQLLTGPVWETGEVDRTGSGTYRSLQVVRVSSHMGTSGAGQLGLLYLGTSLTRGMGA